MGPTEESMTMKCDVTRALYLGQGVTTLWLRAAKATANLTVEPGAYRPALPCLTRVCGDQRPVYSRRTETCFQEEVGVKGRL